MTKDMKFYDNFLNDNLLVKFLFTFPHYVK